MNSRDATDVLNQDSGPSTWVDRRSTIPLYHQLFLNLRDRLFSGEWKAGELFLRDSDIEQSYGVSRITVRKAMDSLVGEGLVVRFRGRGTFVAALPVSDLTKFSPLRPLDFDDIEGEYRREIIKVGKVLVSKHTADRLRVPENHQVSVLRLLHWGGDTPVCTEAIFVDDFKWPDIFDLRTLEQENVSEIYRRRGMKIKTVRQSVSAVLPAPETARKLALEPGQPALYITRVSYSADDVPVDFRLIYCRGDRYVLTQDIQPWH
ncbi:MAG TPA: GntR family transcriptional regulator [Devosia sp.]|nr:GntR family transcriptional regulator [Devosia sp.]